MCDSKTNYTTMRGLKDHLDSHINGNGKAKWEVEPRAAFLREYNLTICIPCGKLAGNGPKNAMHGMHRSCWNEKKCGEKESKGKENAEKPSTVVSPPNGHLDSNGHLVFPPILQTVSGDGKIHPEFDNAPSRTTFMDIVMSSVNTLRSVPSARQAEFDECADYALDVLLEDPSNPERWKPFLSLPRAVLVYDGLTGTKKKRLRDSNFSERVKSFKEGKWEELVEEAVRITKRESGIKRPPSEDSQEKRWTRMTFEGRQSAVLREMMSTGACEDTPETLKEAQSKFPKRKHDVKDPIFEPNFEPPTFTPAEIEAKAQKMKHRSASGSKISMEMILGWMRSAHRPILREKITRVVNIFAAGMAPEELAMELGIPLTLLKKLPNGVRPIGVPFGLEGLVTALLTTREKEQISKEFLPLQQALSARGAEVTAHTIRSWIIANSMNRRARLLALDFRNMFNELFRSVFLPKFLDHFPAIAAYAYWAYKNVKKMFWKEHLILSEEGLIQGCGLGPLIASTHTQELLVEMNEMLSKDEIEALVIAFLDDQTICCTETMAASIIAFIDVEGKKIGCELNHAKCLLWAPCRMNNTEPTEEDPRLPKSIVISKDDGFTVEGAKILGTFFGTKTYCERMARKWIDERVEPLLKKIVSMKDPTVAMSLMHHSGIVNNMVYIQRTTPSSLISDALSHYGGLLRNALAQIASENITEDMWRIAGLPWKEGGQQMRDPTLHAPAANLASLLACREQVLKAWPLAQSSMEEMIAEAVALLNSKLSSAVTSVKVDSKSMFKQAQLSGTIDHSTLDKLIKDSDQRRSALLLAQQTLHASAWKHTSAKASKDLYLRPDEFQISLKVSLGAKVLPDNGSLCPFCKKAQVDPYGDHVISCPDAGHIVHTHNAYRDQLMAWCRLAGITVQKEVNVKLIDGTTYRADIVLPAGLPGYTSLPVLLDVTFRSPFTKTAIKKACKWSGAAAGMGEDDKDKLLSKSLADSKYTFIPIGVETLGGIGSECVPFTSFILTQLHYRLRKPFHEVAALFWQSLSVLVQRMKSNRILRCQQLLVTPHKAEAVS